MAYERKAKQAIPGAPDSGIMEADRAIQIGKKEDMRHPERVWADPSYASEPLDRLIESFVTYLQGRANPAATGTVEKYAYSLEMFRRSLVRSGDPVVLGSMTPFAITRWIGEQRQAKLSEHGIASRLASVKAFSRKYVYKHLELTTGDLLEKISRITPPEKPFPRLSEAELQRIMACLEGSTYEDTRNRALVACFLATGRRFREILHLKLSDIDMVTGELKVLAKGGEIQLAMLSPKALKSLRQHLRERPSGTSDRVWLTEAGRELTYYAAQTIFRRLRIRSGVARLHCHLLRHNFAQVALEKGAERALVQEMLGHKTEAMTRRYTAAVRQQTAAKKMPAYSPW